MTRNAHVVAAASILFAACADTPVAPDTPFGEESPHYGYENGPDNPGESGVFRFDGTTLLFSSDPPRDLLVAHFQADDSEFFCGGQTGFPRKEIQLIVNQEDVERVVRKLRDAPVFIYRRSDPEPDDCVFFTQNWLYKGTHSVVETDNNVEAHLNTTGANVFGWTAEGTVYDPEGRRCSYNERQNWVWYPDRERFENKNREIRVRCGGDA